MNHTEAILVDFVEGRLSWQDFEHEIYYNADVKKFLESEKVVSQDLYIEDYMNPYEYLICVNYKNAESRLNAHSVVTEILQNLNVEIFPTNVYDRFCDLLLDIQPKYLDIDPIFFEKYIFSEEFRSLKKTEQKRKMKEEINHLFKFQTKPPRWIQNPSWIIENDKPLFFLGQYEIKNCSLFHDDGAVYLFVNQDTGEIKTITQFY